MPENEVDVLIIGAGPAGSTLGYLLASQGVSTAIVDRAAGPEFKIGESLLPEGVRLCREMGLGEALERGPYLEKFGAQFILGDDGASDRFCFDEALRPERGMSAYQVKRKDFDALLQGHAEGAGVRIDWNTKVHEVDFGADDHVAVRAGGDTYAARYVVDASGLSQVVARQRGESEPRADLQRVALFSHFEGVPRDEGERAGDIRVIWTEQGWFWVIPFQDGTTSVGVVGDPESLRVAGQDAQESFDALAGQGPVHRALLAERKQLFPVRRMANYASKVEHKTGERYLLLGDASGFLDPIFSTGAFFAQASAFLARDAILPALAAGYLPDQAARSGYEEKIDLAVRRYKSLIQMFYDRKFMDDVIRSRRRENIRRALTSLLAGDVFHEENPLLRMGVVA